jgi:hypothetical protein
MQGRRKDFILVLNNNPTESGIDPAEIIMIRLKIALAGPFPA